MQDSQASDFDTLHQYAEGYLRRRLTDYERMQLQEFSASFLPPPASPADDEPQRLQDKIAQMMHMIVHYPDGLSRSNWTRKTDVRKAEADPLTELLTRMSDVRKAEADPLTEFLRSGRLSPRQNAGSGDT